MLDPIFFKITETRLNHIFFKITETMLNPIFFKIRKLGYILFSLK